MTAQNTANAGTVGYTRQSAQLQSLPGVQPTGLFTNPTGAGQGVEVAGIGRSASEMLNTQVRHALGQSGYQQVRAEAFSGVEDVLREPGDASVSTVISAYHAAWQDYANNPGDTGAGTALLEASKSLTGRLSSDFQKLENQYSAQEAGLAAEVNQVNSLAEQLAQINGTIRSTGAAGGSTNELLDFRDQIAEQLSALTGGQLRPAADGTGEFLVGGNALVSGETAHGLEVGKDADDLPMVQWKHRPGSAGLDGGSLAGRVAVLSDSGPLAKAMEQYNETAEAIATSTNAVYSTAAAADGSTGHTFFEVNGDPAAKNLGILVTGPEAILHAAAGAGAMDGSVADQISATGGEVLGDWSGYVSGVGSQSRSALDGLTLAVGSESSARASQQSMASVDRDEEAVNLVTFQHAYQASARVLTAVDEMLDTLINRVGLVGR
ncbi:flagellar hook-associated protein FlgK [Citricoccus parietis]|uniref:Flagellar hook-associated protein 1 n=1 Tax=Citricoccus parietis TaxID=592307 RepID=A0ABV5FXK1_9MICC